MTFRGSIPPMQSLCTLRNHCRQWPRNTRYQADATPYLGRTCTGWIAPARGWRTYSIPSSARASSIEKRAGVKFNVIKVTDFGLNVLGSSMYVSNAFAEQRPDTVKKLLRATAKGYRDAMADPKEAAKIMAKHMTVPGAAGRARSAGQGDRDHHQ